MDDETGQICHMDRGQNVITIADTRQRRQLWVERQPCPPEKLIEDIVSLSMAIGQSTTDDSHLDIAIELDGGHGQVLQVLDHLIAREGHSPLIIGISQSVTLRTAVALGISPSEHRRDDNQGLFPVLMLMKRLSQDLDNLFSLIEVCPTKQINNDAVSTQDILAEGLRLSIRL